MTERLTERELDECSKCKGRRVIFLPDGMFSCVCIGRLANDWRRLRGIIAGHDTRCDHGGTLAEEARLIQEEGK